MLMMLMMLMMYYICRSCIHNRKGGCLCRWGLKHRFRWGHVNIFPNMLETALEESIGFLFIASKSNIIGNIMFIFGVVGHDGWNATDNAFFLVKAIQIDAFVNVHGDKRYAWMLQLLEPLFDQGFNFLAGRTPCSA